KCLSLFWAKLIICRQTQTLYLKFSLESVKKLKELMDENRSFNPHVVVSMASYSPCDEKDLPEEFQSVCKREDASTVFERLSTTDCEHPKRQFLMC
uniref:Guanylate cyclase activator 2B n=1 Tax=Strigops habroptila TaxID=2489341 RepID=A0A672TYD2_STRHB